MAMPVPVVSLGEYEELKAELKASQQHLRGKDQGLHILKRELNLGQEQLERYRQEIAQLRSQLARSPLASPGSREDTVKEREQLISQLEDAHGKIHSLERRVQMEQDEKEEIMCERDYYSGKCDSLLKCLDEQRQTQPPSQTAVQSLMEENRQLKMELVEVKAEKERGLNRIERYKRALERYRTREKQLQIITNKQQDPRHCVRRAGELELLANSLSESVKDKSVALVHQKRTNKMLATRIAELEHRLKVLEISGLWTSEDTDLSALLWSEDQATLTPEKLGTFEPELHETKSNEEEEEGEEVEEGEEEGEEERKKERWGEEEKQDYSSTDALHPSSGDEERRRFNHSSCAVQEDNSAMVNLA